jgi:ABC-type sugar transport system ATPase subunit
VRHGVGYLPGDRKAGIVPDQSMAVNVALASLPALSRFGWCDHRAVKRAADDARRRLGIKCHSTTQPIRTLSGGNQQKALVARWLLSGVSVLLVDEPTQGVDIGARAEIHDHLRRFASTGGTVVFASSDLDEVLVLADRVLVLRKGEVGAELVLEQCPGLDRAALLALITGLSREPEHGDQPPPDREGVRV